ncbi:MAG: isoprenylcysteine carboxylmethyltransferase family protein [Gemmatimonadota bacterium]
MIRLGVFALASVAIISVSWRSLLHPASHGFPRFFAFESVLGLLVLNASSWFIDPLGVRQLVSWVLLIGSAVLVVWGFALLRRQGGFKPSEEVSPDFDWERTGHLVTEGIYGTIRHPMYSSVLLLAWGALLKQVNPGTILLAVAASVALTMTAKLEEAENLARFGDEYREYMKRTHRFIPLVF